MDTNNELYQDGLLMHAYICPAIPMGLRTGPAAFEALRVERVSDGQPAALIEIDRNQCAHLWTDAEW